jgi:hypothetical protein
MTLRNTDHGNFFDLNDKYVLLQQLGKHHGKNGVFEIVINKFTSEVTHQRFIPSGIITGASNQVVIGTSGSVSSAWSWWNSIR